MADFAFIKYHVLNLVGQEARHTDYRDILVTRDDRNRSVHRGDKIRP